MSDDLMTPDNVCALLKVTKDWLYDQVQARRIPHVRLGRHLRFRRSEQGVDLHVWRYGHGWSCWDAIRNRHHGPNGSDSCRKPQRVTVLVR